MDRWVEGGSPIKITCRIHAKNVLVRVYYCVIQYQCWLEDENQESNTGGADRFRSKNLPRFTNEVDVKYGSRDVSEGS